MSAGEKYRRGRRQTKIAGAFTWQLIEMKQSPAWRTLSLSARRILDRLEIENHHHGGRANGKLPCTYDHFQEYGVERHAIAPAIRECVALGFIQVTRQGRGGNAEFRVPSLYRLTYRHTDDAEPTNDWRRISAPEEAAAIARAARRYPRPKARNGAGRKTESQCVKPTLAPV